MTEQLLEPVKTRTSVADISLVSSRLEPVIESRSPPWVLPRPPRVPFSEVTEIEVTRGTVATVTLVGQLFRMYPASVLISNAMLKEYLHNYKTDGNVVSSLGNKESASKRTRCHSVDSKKFSG